MVWIILDTTVLDSRPMSSIRRYYDTILVFGFLENSGESFPLIGCFLDHSSGEPFPIWTPWTLSLVALVATGSWGLLRSRISACLDLESATDLLPFYCQHVSLLPVQGQHQCP